MGNLINLFLVLCLFAFKGECVVLCVCVLCVCVCVCVCVHAHVCKHLQLWTHRKNHSENRRHTPTHGCLRLSEYLQSVAKSHRDA